MQSRNDRNLTDITYAGGLMVPSQKVDNRKSFQTIEDASESLYQQLGSIKEATKDCSSDWSQSNQQILERLQEMHDFYQENNKALSDGQTKKQAQQDRIKFEHNFLKEWVEAEKQDDQSKEWMGLIASKTTHAWAGAKKSDVYSSAQKKNIEKAFNGELPEEMKDFDKLSLSPSLSANSELKKEPASELVEKGTYAAQMNVAYKFIDQFFSKEDVIDPLLENIRKLNNEGKVSQNGQDTLLFPPVGLETKEGEEGYKHNSRNVLASAYARVIKEGLIEAINEDQELKNLNLNVGIVKDFVQTTELNSTEAGPVANVVTKHRFDVADSTTGALLFDGYTPGTTSNGGRQKREKINNAIGIAVDDDGQLGGTIASVIDFIEENCKACAGSTTVVESPGVGRTRASEKQVKKFEELVGNEEFAKYNEFFESSIGIKNGVAGLTPPQLAVLYSTVTNHNAKNTDDAQKNFQEMKDSMSLDERTMHDYKEIIGTKHYLEKAPEEAKKLQNKVLSERQASEAPAEDDPSIKFEIFRDIAQQVTPENLFSKSQKTTEVNHLPFANAARLLYSRRSSSNFNSWTDLTIASQRDDAEINKSGMVRGYGS